LAVLCGGLFLPSCEGCADVEEAALMEIHGQFDYGYEASPDCCGWEGVTCNPRTGRVTGLDLTMLSNIYDYGSSLLNATIFLPLQELRNLSLRNLGIQGCVPGAGNSLSPNIESILLLRYSIVCPFLSPPNT
jgi:hypothetical protein